MSTPDIDTASLINALRMELRDDLNGLKGDLGGVRSELIDLHKAMNAQTWKLVSFVMGFGAMMASVVFYIAKHVQ